MKTIEYKQHKYRRQLLLLLFLLVSNLKISFYSTDAYNLIIYIYITFYMFHSSYIILQVEVIDVTLTVVSLITPFQLRRILAKVHSPRSSQYFSSILNNKVVDTAWLLILQVK